MAIHIIENSVNFKWTDLINPTTEELYEVSNEFQLHQDILKDCLEPAHLPKHEEIGDAHFLITRLLNGTSDQKADSIQEISDKVAIFYKEKFLLTIHRLPQDFIKEIKNKNIDILKVKTTPEIVTKILWHVFNSYDKPGIALSHQVDQFESKVFLKTELTSVMMEDLYYMKRRSSVCRKLLLLSGEVINSIATIDVVAMQDVRDLHVKLLNMYGQVHEDLTNLQNIYLSMSAQKTNDVMKVLTIFSVFFMPLTFIAGIYGMNFEFMPELKSKFGYPGILLFMSITSGFIFLWFRRKKWL